MNAITIGWDNDAGAGQWAIRGPRSLIWTDGSGNSILDQSGAAVDAQFTPGSGFGGGSQLYSAVLISLFTDAAAGSDEAIPDRTGDPRGWWGGPIGSRLWLRSRSKATPDVPALIKRDIEDALQWLVDDGVVASIAVTAAYERPNMVGAQVVLRRQDGARSALSFAKLWES